MTNSRANQTVVRFRELHADLALKKFVEEFQPALKPDTPEFEVVADVLAVMTREYIHGDYQSGDRMKGVCHEAYKAFKGIESPLAQDSEFRSSVVKGMYRALNNTYEDAQALNYFNQQQHSNWLTQNVGSLLAGATT